MKFIKKENNIIVEAPSVKILENGTTVVNYNLPSNEKNLLADGYLKYDGNRPLSYIDIVDGKIVELQYPSASVIREQFTRELYNLKCGVAYTGIILQDIDHSYTFETNTNSITLINSTLVAAQDDSTVLQWKVYENNKAVFYALTIKQLKILFAFGMTVINAAFATESSFLDQIQAMSDEQLMDDAFVEELKATAREQFATINKTINVNDLQPAQ